MPNMPEVDELVLATVKKIMPYGAFCSLDEYGQMEAFLHISEVAPRWIKNIHEFLKDGQRLVCKVYNVIPEKGQVDISLKRITESEKKRKLESVRHERRATKLFEVCTKQAKSTTHEAMAARKALSDRYGDLISAFDEISEKGEEALKDLKIEKGLAKALLMVAQKSMKKAKAELDRVGQITAWGPDGIEQIKKLLTSIKPPAETEVAVHYLGAPRYQFTISAKDFKEAQKALDGLMESLEADGKKGQITIEWEAVAE